VKKSLAKAQRAQRKTVECMPVPDDMEFFIDPNRCIGCRACVQACGECDTHRGHPMIHLEYVDRARSTQTVPVVCMHCESPTCAEVCPADAIKKEEDGVVLSARKPRCVGCSNCVLACPFGVPKMESEYDLMMKCDMCYDRTSVGLKPMCASVCPSGALFFGTRQQLAEQRPRSAPVNQFRFGGQTITTKVQVLAPRGGRAEYVDVVSAMSEESSGRTVALDMMLDALHMGEDET
jgi:Fe-S-cluster-containing dehydrogenase component